MTPELVTKAIEIINNSNSIKVSFNVPINDNYSNTHKILIHESNASVINKLIEHGFSLNMVPKGLSVNHYSSIPSIPDQRSPEEILNVDILHPDGSNSNIPYWVRVKLNELDTLSNEIDDYFADYIDSVELFDDLSDGLSHLRNIITSIQESQGWI